MGGDIVEGSGGMAGGRRQEAYPRKVVMRVSFMIVCLMCGLNCGARLTFGGFWAVYACLFVVVVVVVIDGDGFG